MNSNVTKLILVIGGAFLFNYLFSNEQMGVNTTIYSLLVVVGIRVVHRQALKGATTRWLLAAHLFSMAMVVLHNTGLSKMAYSVTLALFAAFALHVHRSAWFAAGSFLTNALCMPASFAENFAPFRVRPFRIKSFSRLFRFALFPLMLLIVFFELYSAANDAFRQLRNALGRQLQLFYISFFEVFSIRHFQFLLLGWFITGALLLKSNVAWFIKKEGLCTDELKRRKVLWRDRAHTPFYQLMSTVMGRFAQGMMALKNENVAGIITLILLNAMLLVVNLLDINHLWFNFEYTSEEPAYRMVHEGTELLIASIVLAMALLLFFFRGNLNFYRGNKWLRYGAYAWIAQNIVLVISVAIRDYYYIARHGLAHKRIGVLLFLLMVVIGLVTVYIKILRKKTRYYLFRVNGFACIIVLVLASGVHWDELIARYNIQRKEMVLPDIPFLLQMSDKVLPLLEAHRDVLKTYQADYQEQLNKKKTAFIKRQQQLSWLSWNYADASTAAYYSQHENPVKQ